MSLHERLTETPTAACKVCAYILSLSQREQVEWQVELLLPLHVVSNMSIVRELKKHGVSVDEASVRRHRRNHVDS